MNALPRLAFLLGVGLLSQSSAAAREKWIHARTEHFEMFSSASERESRELLSKLEQFRATVLTLFPLRLDREPRATVVLFATDREFKPYRPLYHGKSQDASGYFVGSADEAVIALAADGDFEATCEIIFHEYVHLLLRARGENQPPWLNEGLAELFSTFTIAKASFEMGREKPEHVTLLRQSRLMPLGRLFAVTQQSPEYNEGTRRDIFYAESWALLHFLFFGRDRMTYLPKLNRFVDLEAAPGAVPERCFREAFGMDYDDMESELRDYLRRGRYSISHGRLPLGDLSAQMRFRPAADFERDVALLNLRWRLQRSADTALRLRRMIQSHPDSPRPHEILAAVALQEGDTEGALEHWGRAAELGSDNAFVYLQLANEKLVQLSAESSLDFRMPANLAATLRGWLDRAVALSPDYLEAYESLAFVEALAERPRVKIINRVQEVVPQMRDTARTLYAFAVVRWRVKDYATSRAIIEKLLANPRLSPVLRRSTQRLNARLPPPAEPASAPVVAAEPAAPP
jgi:hypothetical protein